MQIRILVEFNSISKGVFVENENRFRDWAYDASQKIKQKHADQRLKDEKLVAESKLKEQQAPLVWEQVRTDIKEMCTALIAEQEEDFLKWDSVKTNEIVVRVPSKNTSFTAEFSPQQQTISFPDFSETFPCVVKDGTVMFMFANNLKRPHDIARRFMDAVISRLL
jgi:hypothetical protein